VLNNGKNVARAQSWWRDLFGVQHLTSLILLAVERQVRDWGSQWEGGECLRRLIQSWKGEQSRWSGWLLGFLLGIEGVGHWGGCQTLQPTDLVDSYAGHLAGRPSVGVYCSLVLLRCWGGPSSALCCSWKIWLGWRDTSRVWL